MAITKGRFIAIRANQGGRSRDLGNWPGASRVPGGVLFRTHPEKSSERQHRVSDAATDLFDHEPLDASDTLAAWVVDRSSALYPVAFDERELIRRMKRKTHCGARRQGAGRPFDGASVGA